MKRAQESLEIATQENKALTEQVLLKNGDLKRFALRCMCMKIELALSNAGLSRYSRTKRSFGTSAIQPTHKSAHTHAHTRTHIPVQKRGFDTVNTNQKRNVQ